MNLKHHFVFSIIVSALFYPFLGLNVLIVFLAGAFADVDHVLIYIWRYRRFNFRETYTFFRGVTDGSEFYPVLHMIELCAAILFLSLYISILVPVFIGLASHIALDFTGEKFMRNTGRNFTVLALRKKGKVKY